MKTILLVGPSRCGKTTTMKLIYEKIKPQGNELEPKKPIKEGGKKDFRCVIEYKNKTIAFYSRGDCFRAVKEEIEKNMNNIDILIICCNDKFKGLKGLKDKYDCIVIRKSKKNKPLHDQANAKFCEDIIEKINSLAKGVSK